MNVTTGTGMTGRSTIGSSPVIVLTMARSGSTLLRFILDSHPELACPPETCLGSACFTLARLWDLLEPSPQSARGEFRPFRVPAELSEPARTSIVDVIDDVYGRYVARHGKRRWCDKSLDNIGIAELLADLYPGAQFICLYRHCLDVVVSAMEACPWGLNGYGFEPYIASSPGNGVAAISSCWLDRTMPIIEFQQRHPDRCHGIRYEDLVTAPEQVAASLFDFLDVQQVPGISAACFSTDHETRGPGDHKIWFTSSVNNDSLGQGRRVPVAMIPPELLVRVNQVLSSLDYQPADDRWSASTEPADPRADAGLGDADRTNVAGRDAEPDAAAQALVARLTAIAAGPASDLSAWWADTASQQLTFVLSQDQAAGRPVRWTLRREGSGLTMSEGAPPDTSGVEVAAANSTWLAVLTGRANLATEQRAGRLRVSGPATEPGGPPPVGPAEMRLLARLVG